MASAENAEAIHGLKSTIDESELIYHEPVGGGATGVVYRVTWKSRKFGHIEAAAKRIPIFKEDNVDEKFGSEIYYLQSLSHANIIAYYGHVVSPDHLVIVTEYAEKGSLFDYLHRTSHLPPKLKLKWAIQAARGIKYLQDKNIVHRDVKSGNFLITSQDNLKICDFGIAKDLSSTTASSRKGTIRWLAPEAFSFTSSSMLSQKADIFSFGIVLWELETCELPYKGAREERVMWLVGVEGSRPEIPPNCSPVLKDLMQRCWNTDRNRRPDMEVILQQLESCKFFQIHD